MKTYYNRADLRVNSTLNVGKIKVGVNITPPILNRLIKIRKEKTRIFIQHL